MFIFYDQLPSYFFVFGIYDPNNECLSWEYTQIWCQLLGVEAVPVIYQGIWGEFDCQKSWKGKGVFPTFASVANNPKWPNDFFPTEAEGCVVRLVDRFKYEDFRHSVAKYVHKNHVGPNAEYWANRPVLSNKLKEINV